MFLYRWVTLHPVYALHRLYPPICGHLGWFHSLAVVNSAAVNTGVQVSLLCWLHFLQIHAQGVDHMAVLFLVFWWPSILFSIIAVLISIPINSVEGLLFLVWVISVNLSACSLILFLVVASLLRNLWEAVLISITVGFFYIKHSYLAFFSVFIFAEVTHLLSHVVL
jgi:hypothetical protein